MRPLGVFLGAAAEVARKTQLPVVIHSREADDDTARILEEETGKGGAFPAVLHCFTGGRDLAMRGVALGVYVSFTGILTFKNSDALRAIAAELPADRILVETDAPYLAPNPYRGKRNEPSYVVETAKMLATTRGVSVEALSVVGSGLLSVHRQTSDVTQDTGETTRPEVRALRRLPPDSAKHDGLVDVRGRSHKCAKHPRSDVRPSDDREETTALCNAFSDPSRTDRDYSADACLWHRDRQ